MLEQPLPMSSALRTSVRSLGFLMGYLIQALHFVKFSLFRVIPVAARVGPEARPAAAKLAHVCAYWVAAD